MRQGRSAAIRGRVMRQHYQKRRKLSKEKRKRQRVDILRRDQSGVNQKQHRSYLLEVKGLSEKGGRGWGGGEIYSSSKTRKIRSCGEEKDSSSRRNSHEGARSKRKTLDGALAWRI